MKKILIYILSTIAIAAAASSLSAATVNKSNPVPERQKNEKVKVKVSKPDMEKIRKEVLDPTSKYYYPRLMANYERNETIQSVEDYRHLYLGYLFQEDYDPYRHSEYAKKIEPLYYKTKDELTRAECDSIIKYAVLSLADNPFDLRQMNYLIFAYEKRGKINTAKIWQYRLNHILAAIKSTGNGLTADDAMYVIYPRHEYDIINFLGGQAESQEFVQPYYDHVKLKKTDKKTPEGYYFNINDLLREYYRKNPESPE